MRAPAGKQNTRRCENWRKCGSRLHFFHTGRAGRRETALGLGPTVSSQEDGALRALLASLWESFPALGLVALCSARVCACVQPTARADPPAVLAPSWEASGPSQGRAVCRSAPRAGGGPDLWPRGPTLTPEAGLAGSVLCVSDALPHLCLRQFHLSS